MNPKLGAFALAAGSVRLYLRHFGTLFPLAFVPALALSLLTWALGFGDDPVAQASAGVLANLIAFAANLVVGFVVTGVISLAALDVALGKRHSVGEYLTQTLRHLWPVVVLGALLSVATALGVIVAVVPGLYIAARWLPWAQAVLFEDLGWGGLARAQGLTAGRRWPLVGALVLMVVPVAAILLGAGVVISVAGASPAVITLVEAVATAIYYGLVACFTALTYLRLRALTEGLDDAAIAASFD